MSGYLRDTIMISEIIRITPHPRMGAFFIEHGDLWLSSIVIHELEYGVQPLARGQRRSGLQADLSSLIGEYEDRILPLERRGAEWAAHFRVQAQRSGRTLQLGDALIAGIAKAHDLAVATRNVADFRRLDIEVSTPGTSRSRHRASWLQLAGAPRARASSPAPHPAGQGPEPVPGGNLGRHASRLKVAIGRTLTFQLDAM